ncbi:MFS transporter [Actinoallomurus sp. CA-150999]|uniref:MFS transporter n=1 Tax=Actinoallomurus sp. CA-150999 TaxID=3239887 RepID=UPI003D8BB2B0
MGTGSEIVQGLPWRWRVQGKIFIIGGLGYMFDAWDVTLNGYLTPLLAEHFDLTVAEKGLVATANLIGMAVGAVVWGTIADRVGRKKAFSLTLLVFALFSVLAALSPTYDFFLAARFLAGVGLGGCIPVDYALVGEFTPSRQRGRVLTAMDVWWPIGGTLCGLVATALLPVHGNWRWMLAVMVLPALLLFWVRRGVPESPLYLAGAGREAAARAVIDDLVARTGAESRPYAIVAPGPRAPRGVQATFAQLARIWRYSPRITSVAWLLFVSIMLVYYVSLTWLPTILKSQGYGSYAAFSGTTAMTAVGAVGVILSAFLVEVVGRKWVIGISAPLASAVLVLFASTLKVHSVALLWIAVFGFVIQFTIPVLYAYVAELYPTALRASGFGWASSMSRIASGFIPFIFGSVLWPQLGLTMTFTVTAAFVLVAVVWMTIAGPETKGRNLDADAPTVPAPAPIAESA